MNKFTNKISPDKFTNEMRVSALKNAIGLYEYCLKWMFPINNSHKYYMFQYTNILDDGLCAILGRCIRYEIEKHNKALGYFEDDNKPIDYIHPSFDNTNIISRYFPTLVRNTNVDRCIQGEYEPYNPMGHGYWYDLTWEGAKYRLNDLKIALNKIMN